MVFSFLFLFWCVKTLGFGFHLEKHKKGNTTSVKMKHDNRFWSKQSTVKKNSNYNTIVLRNCCCLLEGVKYRLIVEPQIAWGATPDSA